MHLQLRALRVLLLALSLTGLPLPVGAELLVGDLNGDGEVDLTDAPWLTESYEASRGDRNFDPAADLNRDGRVDRDDVLLFGASFGTRGGPRDQQPPLLHVTLNDIPDEHNDLLVVPPERFQVTVHLDRAGGSAIDRSSLSVRSSRAIGPYPAGSELAPLFEITPTRAVFEVPPGSELERSSHVLTVSVRDAAANTASATYGFAVRDYPASGPPLGNLQTVFLDFEQDRSMGPEVDFLEDLRSFGLSSPEAPGLERRMRDWIVEEIVARAHAYVGRDPDGSPGGDAANLVFVSSRPDGPHARLCVGGESRQGPYHLGAAVMDRNNQDETPDECVFGAYFGIFPQALDDVWGADRDFHSTFSPFDPDLGGVPVGVDPRDRRVLAEDFDPGAASQAELERWIEVQIAAQAFAQALATVSVHETGHTLGLVPHGAPGGGLFGGKEGSRTDHNVTPSGQTPERAWLMNAGDSFGFAAMTGQGGAVLPTFRPLNWAYLRDRLVLDPEVDALFDAPKVSSVHSQHAPRGLRLAIRGANFVGRPRVELVDEAGVSYAVRVRPSDGQTLRGRTVQKVPPGRYALRVTNRDGQVAVRKNALRVGSQPS